LVEKRLARASGEIEMARIQCAGWRRRAPQ
jgi:hypothetical protein